MFAEVAMVAELQGAMRKVIEALMGAKRVVITGHVKPDGDALGSALALAGFLRGAGRDVLLTGIEPLPDDIRYVEGSDSVLRASKYKPQDGDLLCLVDHASQDRMQMDLRPLYGTMPMAIIDHHHPKNPYPTEAVYAIPDCSSTSELVWNLAQEAGWTLTLPIAEALWMGIITDTNRFSYPSTTPSTLRCAASLLEMGVDSDRAANEAYNLVSMRRFHLRERLERNVRLLCGGRLSIGHLLPEDYAAEGATNADSNNFVDVPRFIRGVEVAAFVYPVDNGRKTCVSTRSASDRYNVAEFCGRWGGGGHARAAGATLEKPVAQALPEIMEALKAFVES